MSIAGISGVSVFVSGADEKIAVEIGESKLSIAINGTLDHSDVTVHHDRKYTIGYLMFKTMT